MDRRYDKLICAVSADGEEALEIIIAALSVQRGSGGCLRDILYKSA